MIPGGIKQIIQLGKIIHLDDNQPTRIVRITVDNADIIVDVFIDTDYCPADGSNQIDNGLGRLNLAEDFVPFHIDVRFRKFDR